MPLAKKEDPLVADPRLDELYIADSSGSGYRTVIDTGSISWNNSTPINLASLTIPGGAPAGRYKIWYNGTLEGTSVQTGFCWIDDNPASNAAKYTGSPSAIAVVRGQVFGSTTYDHDGVSSKDFYLNAELNGSGTAIAYNSSIGVGSPNPDATIVFAADRATRTTV